MAQVRKKKKPIGRKATKRRKSAAHTAARDRRGINLGYGIYGKHLFRIREEHIANHLIPLMAKRKLGAAKLDLVLRCVALQKRDAGKRATGLVLPRHTWEQIHDLCRDPSQVGADPPGLDSSAEGRRLKRKWVGQQLRRLEELNLVSREFRPGGRPKLLVLRDDGSGRELDDPHGTGMAHAYITILGSVIASGQLAEWKTPDLSAYMAAMSAERYDRRARENAAPGTGAWFRSLAWFADLEGRYGPRNRVPLPFTVSTLERGFARLEARSLVAHTHIQGDPTTSRPLQGRRNLYTNNFGSLNDGTKILSPAEYEERIKEEDDDEELA